MDIEQSRSTTFCCICNKRLHRVTVVKSASPAMSSFLMSSFLIAERRRIGKTPVTMKSTFTRRDFIKRTALATGAVSAASFLPVPNILGESKRGAKLNCVQIGCGGRSLSAHVDWIVNNAKDNLVAIVDADEKRHAEVKRFLKAHDCDPDKLQIFTDYRKMFDKIGKQINPVFIATPNHHHALPATIAMQPPKPPSSEKPF